MINLEFLEANVLNMSNDFLNAEPYEHIVIDNFCDPIALKEALHFIPGADSKSHNKSRDYIFAKNKFEKADFQILCPQLEALKNDLMSPDFATFVSKITNEKIFIDPSFHGGGLHQGGLGSFLDMHADFNFHPENLPWFRNVNILLYLNENWRPEFGGELKLMDGRRSDSKVTLIQPIFNRAVIMFTRDYTLHGYDPINFPKGTFRTSIAAYGYTDTGKPGKLRTTIWKPDGNRPFKRILGRIMPDLVKIKARIFGSGTTKNK